jgi:hypothetical protein
MACRAQHPRPLSGIAARRNCGFRPIADFTRLREPKRPRDAEADFFLDKSIDFNKIPEIFHELMRKFLPGRDRPSRQE